MLDFPDPLVARYLEPEKLLEPARRLLSDQALYLDYCVRLELNWLRVLARHGRFAESLVDEAQERCADIDIQEIAEEEARVHHDLKAVVNVMTRYCPEELRPYVHLGATSYDILSNAHLLRLRDGCREIALPALEAVARELIRLARQESETHQVGRTHGQHAEPVTFGHAMAVYLDRMGFCIQSLKRSLTELRGKFSGAVGAYNTLGLLFEDPRAVEREVLALAGLTPARNSTQITHPEPALAVFHHLTAAFGVLANLADDLRHLQRTELAEVAEAYREGSQVGSSAMPHKRNPWNCETVTGLARVVRGMLLPVLENMATWHERDLSNSSVERIALPDVCALTDWMLWKFADILDGLVIHPDNMERNLGMMGGLVASEQVMLALIAAGLSREEAYGVAQRNAARTWDEGMDFREAIEADPTVIDKLTPEQVRRCFDVRLHLQHLDHTFDQLGI